MKKRELRVGLIGTGFMGQAHVFGYATAEKVFDLPVRFVMDTVADVTDDAANSAARRFGFETATTDWRQIIDNPAIDIVNITAPNALHKEMALAAIAAGKHVYCEKPLAPLADDAREMTEAAEAAGIKTQVGFNYLCNPMLALAKQMIEAGELGEIRAWRGVHAEDYMRDATGPWTFRHDPAGGGAFADIGSHALATAEYLCGPITRVMGDCVTHIAERPSRDGPRRIEVDDIGRAFLRFASPAHRARSKRTGSRRVERCSTISRSMARKAGLPSARSASTNCITSTRTTARDDRAITASKRVPTTHLTAASASQRDTRSASTT